MALHTFKCNEKCKSCNGTGLYVGMAERDGSAVVCHTCKGIGEHKFVYKYEDFEGREKKKDVEYVFEINPGICIGKDGQNGKSYKLKNFGGMSYENWLAGKQFSIGMENRKFTCPAWWYQSTNYDLKPTWKKCITIGSFSSCKHFLNKKQCWEKFDQEGVKHNLAKE